MKMAAAKTERMIYMKKITQISAVSLSAVMAFCSAVPLTASAQYVTTMNVNEDITLSMAIREKETLSDTVYVSSEDLKNGDYTFKASVLIETEDSLEDMWHFHSWWDAVREDETETPFIQTQNVYSYRSKWNDDKMNKFLDEVEAANDPYAYVFVRTSNDPQIICSAGPYKVFYKDDVTGEEHFFDLDYNEETGTAYFEYSKLFGSKTYTKVLHHYDPDTPYGEPITDYDQRYLDVHALSTGFTGAWVTEKIGSYYEMGGYDVVIDQNTPEGVYYLKLANNSNCSLNYMSGYSDSVIPTNNYEDEKGLHNDPAYWLKIVVGNPEEAQAETECDINNDGTVDVSDAAEILRIYAESASADEANALILKESAVNADVNGDGTVDVADAAIVLETYSKTAASVN